MPVLRKRTDSNQKDIIEAYKAHGFSVADTSSCGFGFPDLVVAKFKRNYLVEVKQLKGKLRKTQMDFIDCWRGDYRIVRCVDDVMRHAKEVMRDGGGGEDTV